MIQLNFPNILTLIRVSLIPILIVIYYVPYEHSNVITSLIFVLASITDWLDGYIARKFNQETKFGAFCDPVADKLIVVIALMLIVESYNNYMLTIPSIIIVSREVLIAGLREWMAHQGKSNLVSVMKLSKVKTFIQMLAISILLYASNSLNIIGQIGIIALFIAAFLTLWTMLVYLIYAWPGLSDRK